ncbi:MAG: type VI secretion system baseplate subunit TssE [Gammaproteobacteria bacterium]|nr:type VI secretion system baseplate subunit TssE [Gammaproteobacteria bacterium]
MAELTQKERLQPSLLVRLSDDAPLKKMESREQRVLSLQRLRKSVIHDLAWLLNTVHLASLVDLDDYPEVAHSVLNYGMPDLAGKTVSGADVGALERGLRQAIRDYEPRILHETLQVRVILSEDQTNYNAIRFMIEGRLWAHPMPLQLYLKTEVDLDSGSVSIEDVSGSGGS